MKNHSNKDLETGIDYEEEDRYGQEHNKVKKRILSSFLSEKRRLNTNQTKEHDQRYHTKHNNDVTLEYEPIEFNDHNPSKVEEEDCQDIKRNKDNSDVDRDSIEDLFQEQDQLISKEFEELKNQCLVYQKSRLLNVLKQIETDSNIPFVRRLHQLRNQRRNDILLLLQWGDYYLQNLNHELESRINTIRSGYLDEKRIIKNNLIRDIRRRLAKVNEFKSRLHINRHDDAFSYYSTDNMRERSLSVLLQSSSSRNNRHYRHQGASKSRHI